MNEYVNWLVEHYRYHGTLVDSNIMVLLLVGYYDADLIGRVRRTEHYLPEDFVLASEIVESFDRVVTLHSILTEVSNLSRQISSPHDEQAMITFAGWIHRLHEHQLLGSEVAGLPLFGSLGLTDTAVIHVAQYGYVVFSDDGELTGRLERFRLPCLNFNHVREDAWRN